MTDDLTFISAPPPSGSDAQQPVPFSLTVWRTKDADGQFLPEPVEETHEFTCLSKAEVSGVHITNVSRAAADGDLSAAKAIWEFFEQVMLPDDLGRLDDITSDPDVYIAPDLLMNVSLGLFGVYAGRPTRQQRRQSPGRTRARATSGAARSSRASG